MNTGGSAAAHRLAGVALNVASPEQLAAFYTRHLGMAVDRSGEFLRLGYGGPGAGLELRPASSPDPYVHDGSDEYWKIGITLPDVDMAFEQLSRAGVAVTQPRQFLDIGYMCHLTDPDGFQIELLQHTFEGRPRTSPGNPDLPLGGGAQIGQITLRVANLDNALALYQRSMGMRLLSKQVVAGRGFTLYFLAFTGETPPNGDIEAVEDRPWLWQRPYTTLELQHLTEPERPVRPAASGRAGYAGLLIEDRRG
ncbi:VOC family protein [Anderseniella sp. Alg231-50]|uniref:VOC family protein n=1 Tax=Anderseniella sp. Alg231-50 TaxID=1922226 RepID=UPI000D55274E